MVATNVNLITESIGTVQIQLFILVIIKFVINFSKFLFRIVC
jgi:hypothetical protein